MLKELVKKYEQQADFIDYEIAKADSLREQICAKIREDRITNAHPLRWLALKVGISAPYLSDIELGRRFPSQKVLDKIVVLLTSKHVKK